MHLNKLMKLNEYQRSISFFDLGFNEVKCISKANAILWPLPKVTQISKLKLDVSKTVESFETRIHKNGDESLYI